jgi:hypothetical protein
VLHTAYPDKALIFQAGLVFKNRAHDYGRAVVISAGRWSAQKMDLQF